MTLCGLYLAGQGKVLLLLLLSTNLLLVKNIKNYWITCMKVKVRFGVHSLAGLIIILMKGPHKEGTIYMCV